MDSGFITMTLFIAFDLLLFVALFFAIGVLRNLKKVKSRKPIVRIKRVVFAWLTAGIGFLALAFLINSIYALFYIDAYYTLADIFFPLSYISFTIGFGYFWHSSRKLHKLHIKEPIFIIGVSCAEFIWLYYLFVIHIIPGSVGEPALTNALNYFHHIIVSVIFILTLIVHPRLKSRVIRTPLWYISNGVFTYFIAFMFYSYSSWTLAPDFIHVVYAVLFFLSSGYFALGFYAAKKKY